MMDPPILPKGIVINTTWTYDEIAKEPVVSPEALKKYWRGISYPGFPRHTAGPLLTTA